MSSFEEFVARETVRQQLRGYRVPLQSTQLAAYAQWIKEARRRYQELKVDDAAPSDSKDKDQSQSPSGSSFALQQPKARDIAESLATIEDMLATSSATTDSISECTPAPQQEEDGGKGGNAEEAGSLCRDAEEVRWFISSLEVLVRLHLLRPEDATLRQTIRLVQSKASMYQRNNCLGPGEGQYAKMHTAYELMCFNALLLKWKSLQEVHRKEILAAAWQLVKGWKSGAFDRLRHELRNYLEGDAASVQSPDALQPLVRNAALDCPLEFHSRSLAAIRRVEPTFAEPTGVPCRQEHEEVAHNEGVGEEVGDKEERDRRSNYQAPPATRGTVVLSEDERREILAGIKSGSKRNNTRATIRVDHHVRKRSRETSPDESVGELLQLNKKKPRVDLLTPTPAVSLAAAVPTTRLAGGRRGVLDLVLPTTAQPPQPNATLASTASSTTVVHRHSYPCRSRYHAAFSTPDKHASRECHYCSACHMMEFLFNGCISDCTWIHKPTARKISVHLSRFPEVLKLAQRRFSDWSAGIDLLPVLLPLQ